MNATANTPNSEAPEVGAVQQTVAVAGTPLDWKSKRCWGSVGLTHYAETQVGNDTYRYVIDQPRQHDWQLRGWVNGSFCLFRDRTQARTLRGMKDLASAHHAEKLAAVR